MRLRRDFKADEAEYAARAILLRDVLQLDCVPGSGLNVWMPFGVFEPDGRCVATLDAAVLSLIVEGVTMMTGAIRAVATHPDHRGRGLFRALMDEALTWFETRGALVALLYTADPAIYARFGFRELPQHSFVGNAPKREFVGPTRRLRLDDPVHRQLVRDLVRSREPVSSRFALQIDPDQYLGNLRAEPSLSVTYLPDANALLVFEQDGQELAIVDYVTLSKPSMAQVIGAIPGTARRLRTMFAPDRLDWDGQPESESTGLLVRGVLPYNFDAPFMLPPTVEF